MIMTTVIKKALFSIAVILSAGALYAQGTGPEKEYKDTIIMKNGTVYEGYISELSTKGDFWIKAFSSTMTFDKDSITIISSGNSASVRFKNQSFNDVVILEDGDIVKFRSDHETIIQTKKSEVEKVLKPIVPNVIDVIIADKSYEGNIIETAYGKYTKILTGDKKHVVKSKNIKSQSRKTEAEGREALDMTLFPYLDEYEMKDKSVVTGILVSQNMADGALIFKTKEGALLPLNYGNIVKVKKIVNNNYNKMVYPVDTAAMAEMYINETEVRLADSSAFKSAMKPAETILEKGDIVCLPVAAGKDLIIIPGKDITVCKKEKVKDFILVPFNPLDITKNGNIRLGKADTLNAIQPTNNDKEDGLLYIDYKNLNAGYYVLFNKKDSEAIPLWVMASEN